MDHSFLFPRQAGHPLSAEKLTQGPGQFVQGGQDQEGPLLGRRPERSGHIFTPFNV
jgi:hypothetical protein